MVVGLCTLCATWSAVGNTELYHSHGWGLISPHFSEGWCIFAVSGSLPKGAVSDSVNPQKNLRYAKKNNIYIDSWYYIGQKVPVSFFTKCPSLQKFPIYQRFMCTKSPVYKNPCLQNVPVCQPPSSESPGLQKTLSREISCLPKVPVDKNAPVN